MTLDEAIKHAREKAEEQRKDNDTCVVKEEYGCKDCAYYYSKPCIECAEEHEQLAEWLEELKEYRDLEEQGLLLKLPCKIGDTVYQLINSHIYEYKVIGICFDIFQNKWMYEVAYQIGLEWFKTMCDFDAFGKSKTVFLTKEEAEKALERLECAE